MDADPRCVDSRISGYRCGAGGCDGLVPPPALSGTAAGWTCIECNTSHAHRAAALVRANRSPACIQIASTSLTRACVFGRQERSSAEAQAAYSVAQDSSRRGDYEQARSLLEALVDKHSATLFKQHAVLCESSPTSLACFAA